MDSGDDATCNYGNVTCNYDDVMRHNGDVTCNHDNMSYPVGDVTYHNGDVTYHNGDVTYHNGDVTTKDHRGDKIRRHSDIVKSNHKYFAFSQSDTEDENPKILTPVRYVFNVTIYIDI